MKSLKRIKMESQKEQNKVFRQLTAQKTRFQNLEEKKEKCN
jgi:hypothetical protein